MGEIFYGKVVKITRLKGFFLTFHLFIVCVHMHVYICVSMYTCTTHDIEG